MQTEHTDRDKELYNAFKKALTLPGTTFRTAVDIAVKSPCSQSYISVEEAYRYVKLRQQDKGKELDKWRCGRNLSPSKRQCLEDVYNKFLLLSKKKEFAGCTPFFITSFACGMPAPCFYISTRRAFDIIRQMHKHGKTRTRSKRNQ